MTQPDAGAQSPQTPQPGSPESTSSDSPETVGGTVSAHSVTLEPGSDMLETWLVRCVAELEDGRTADGEIAMEWSGSDSIYYSPTHSRFHADGITLEEAQVKVLLRDFEGSDGENAALRAVKELAEKHDEDADRRAALLSALDEKLNSARN